MPYDLYLKPQNAKRPFGIYYQQAVKVQGGTSLAQRFLKALLTPRGSALDGDAGTALPDLIGGNLSDTYSLGTTCALAVKDALAQVQKSLGADWAGPTLASATLSNIKYSSPTDLSLEIQLKTTDNVTLSITLPLNTGGIDRAQQNVETYRSLLEGL